MGGAVTIAANTGYTVADNLIYPLSRDPWLIADCESKNVFLTDGVSIYTESSAVSYLNQIALSLGAAVVGLIGSTAPNFAIMIGSKDINGNVQAASTGPTGSMNVGGDTASGATDVGYPVKTGTIYNASLPTPSNAQRVDSQSNQFGELAVQFRNKFRNITGNATTVVKSGSGRLHSIMINRNWTGGTVTIYDNTAGSGTVIATLDVGTPSGGLLSTTGTPGPIMLGPMGLEFATGLTVVTSGSSNNNVTILYC